MSYIPKAPTCKINSCSKPRFVEPNGRVHDFCGRTCAASYNKQPPTPKQGALPLNRSSKNHHSYNKGGNHGKRSTSHVNMKRQTRSVYPKNRIVIVLKDQQSRDTFEQTIFKISKKLYKVDIYVHCIEIIDLEYYVKINGNDCIGIGCPGDLFKKVTNVNINMNRLMKPILFSFKDTYELKDILFHDLVPNNIKKVLFNGERDSFHEFNTSFETKMQIPVYGGKNGKLWEWNSVDHYFQAMKFSMESDDSLMVEIQGASSGKDALNTARKYGNDVREDWEQVKEEVMKIALYAKFTQDDELRDVLLLTGDSSIVKHRKGDRYWGDNEDGKGLNRLGYLIERTRDRIRREIKETP